MKNNKNLVPYKVQDGVTLYFENQLMDKILDIDVKPGVKNVRLSGPLPNTRRAERRVALRSIRKQFPDITELCIGEDIYDVDISNLMFPNVRYIDSDSPNFRNGQYLLRMNSSHGILLKNVFCIGNEESVRPIDAEAIDNYAFEGCLKTDGFFDDTCIFNFPTYIYPHAFDNSALLCIPPDNGLIHDGPVIFAVDEDAEEVVFNKCDCHRYVMPDGFAWRNNTKAIIKDIRDMSCIFSLPKTVVIEKTDCSTNFLTEYLHDNSVLHYAVSKNSDFASIDGILYSKDKKHLIRCPGGRTGDMIVPEGTEFINDLAFYKSNIDSISLPSTLKTIGSQAFACSKISRINFGSGVCTIGEGKGYAFSDCCNLKEVEIPAQVKVIGKYAFFNCSNLKKVILHEGLAVIYEGAFKLCAWLGYVEVPGTVTYLGSECFSNVQILKIPKLVSEVLYSVSLFYGTQSTFFHTKKIITDTNEYIIPSEINVKSLYKLMPDCRNNHLPDDMYNYAANTEAKQDTICYINIICPGRRSETEKYIKRYSKKIALRYLNIGTEESEKLVIWLIQGNFLSKAALKELLETANQKGKTHIAAYILGKFNDAKNHSFKL